ncbi:ATP-binding protein [Actinomadura syzygii]|nr:ATP-binding protein [Actinomadura syzygii]
MAPEIPRLILEPNEKAAGRARRFVAARFAEWGIADDDIGRLVVSELVTNAYVHGEGRIVVRVFVDKHDRLPVVEVWDGGAKLPFIPALDCTATCGRGLLLVAELVREWGVRPLDEGGKVTWAKLH